jgi:hypothetical protein
MDSQNHNDTTCLSLPSNILTKTKITHKKKRERERDRARERGLQIQPHALLTMSNLYIFAESGSATKMIS